jgi:hypothetical protein
MTSCPPSSDASVTAYSAIRVARFGERRGQICVVDRPLLVLYILYDMVSSRFFYYYCLRSYRCVVTVWCVCWPDRLSSAKTGS